MGGGWVKSPESPNARNMAAASLPEPPDHPFIAELMDGTIHGFRYEPEIA